MVGRNGSSFYFCEVVCCLSIKKKKTKQKQREYTKFLNLITCTGCSSVHAYLSGERCAITLVSNYRYPILNKFKLVTCNWTTMPPVTYTWTGPFLQFFYCMFCLFNCTLCFLKQDIYITSLQEHLCGLVQRARRTFDPESPVWTPVGD